MLPLFRRPGRVRPLAHAARAAARAAAAAERARGAAAEPREERERERDEARERDRDGEEQHDEQPRLLLAELEPVDRLEARRRRAAQHVRAAAGGAGRAQPAAFVAVEPGNRIRAEGERREGASASHVP